MDSKNGQQILEMSGPILRLACRLFCCPFWHGIQTGSIEQTAWTE